MEIVCFQTTTPSCWVFFLSCVCVCVCVCFTDSDINLIVLVLFDSFLSHISGMVKEKEHREVPGGGGEGEAAPEEWATVYLNRRMERVKETALETERRGQVSVWLQPESHVSPLGRLLDVQIQWGPD